MSLFFAVFRVAASAKNENGSSGYRRFTATDWARSEPNRRDHADNRDDQQRIDADAFRVEQCSLSGAGGASG
jgi:hypothetical protein